MDTRLDLGKLLLTDNSALVCQCAVPRSVSAAA